MRTKYCEHIIEEGEHQGQRCGEPFQVNFSPMNAHKKYCPTHDSALLESGLLRSRNLHAVQGNREAMRDWVKDRMNIQPRKDAELSEALASIRQLKSLFESKGNDDDTRISIMIDQNLIKILKVHGILNDESSLSFASHRNLLTVQGQLREANERISILEKKLGVNEEGFLFARKEEE